MSDDREKLIRVMDNLESDYRSGKISAEKYSYFRSKYEDKLNSIDARDATRRIRSMQGKSSRDTTKKRQRKPTKNKKKEEQDLVQKYIINPKKSDANYNKKKKSAMDSGTFKLLLLLILVIVNILDKEFKYKDYIIGLLVGIMFLTKQHIGLCLFIPLIFCSKNKLKSFIGMSIPITLLLCYLLFNNSFNDFINYAFLGIFDFGENNSIWLFFPIELIVCCIIFYKLIKIYQRNKKRG